MQDAHRILMHCLMPGNCPYLRDIPHLILSMLKNGLEISLISKITGFSEKEISKLTENLS